MDDTLRADGEVGVLCRVANTPGDITERRVQRALQEARTSPENWMMKYNPKTKQYERTLLGTASAEERRTEEREHLEKGAAKARERQEKLKRHEIRDKATLEAEYRATVDENGRVEYVRKTDAEALKGRLERNVTHKPRPGRAAAPAAEAGAAAAGAAAPDLVDLMDADQVESEFRMAGVEHRPEPPAEQQEDMAAFQRHWALGAVFRRALDSGVDAVYRELAAALQTGRLDAAVMSQLAGALPGMVERKQARDRRAAEAEAEKAAKGGAAARVHGLAKAGGGAPAAATPDGHGARHNIRSQSDYETDLDSKQSKVPPDWVPKSLLDVAQMARQAGVRPVMELMDRLGTPPFELEAMELFVEVVLEALAEQERQMIEAAAQAAAMEAARERMAALGVSGAAFDAAMGGAAAPAPRQPQQRPPQQRRATPADETPEQKRERQLREMQARPGTEQRAAREQARQRQQQQERQAARAFAGRGHSLAGRSGARAEDAAAVTLVDGADPQAAVRLDPSAKEVRVQVVLAAGGRKLTARLNPSHTVADLRRFVDAAVRLPDGASYKLTLRFPRKELANPAATVAQEGLAGAQVTQVLSVGGATAP